MNDDNNNKAESASERKPDISKRLTQWAGANGCRPPDVWSNCENPHSAITIRKGPSPLTVRRPSEILRQKFSPSDILWGNGYLAKGDPLAICGPPGVGKSRFAVQLSICVILGRDFLGWETNGKKTKWLILQTENGNRRLQAELQAQFSALSEREWRVLDERLMFHTLENEADSLLTLSTKAHQESIRQLIEEFKPDVVVYDILRDFASGDLNADKDMAETLAIIGRLTRQGNPQRIPIVIQHARTGKEGAAQAVGWDRGGFARNSKVLVGWSRALINLAPFSPNPDNNDIVVASGKCNNAREFGAFGARCRLETMTSHHDIAIDIEEWKGSVGANAKKTEPRASVSHAVAEVEKAEPNGITKAKLAAAIMKETGIGKSRAYEIIDQAKAQRAIFRHRNYRFYMPKTVTAMQ